MLLLAQTKLKLFYKRCYLKMQELPDENQSSPEVFLLLEEKKCNW